MEEKNSTTKIPLKKFHTLNINSLSLFGRSLFYGQFYILNHAGVLNWRRWRELEEEMIVLTAELLDLYSLLQSSGGMRIVYDSIDISVNMLFMHILNSALEEKGGDSVAITYRIGTYIILTVHVYEHIYLRVH